MCNATPAAGSEPRPEPSPTLKRDNGFRYKPRYGIVLEFPTEEDLQANFESLRAAGHKPRVVTV